MKRRLLPILLTALLTFAACGRTSPSTSNLPTETVKTGNGEITVPVTDTGIWALDYQTALNLLALGVVPEHAGKYAHDLDPYVAAAYSILEDAGVELVEPGDAELVAAAQPELIVGRPNTGNDEIVPRLGDVAPVLILPELPVLDDELDTLGAITGHRDEAVDVVERLESALAELARRIHDSEFAGNSVSVLSACGDVAFCVYGNKRGFGPILDDLGLTRPQSQTLTGNEWGYDSISPENLDQQKAEVIIALTGSVSFGAPSPFESRLLDTSGSRTGEVDFSAWFGVGPLNYLWVINDLEAILFDKGRIAEKSAGVTLWTEVAGKAP